MATSVIEINDAGIIASVDKEIIVESPGYALMDNSSLMVGNQAYENARLKPRWTSNRFWRDLSLDPLSNATAQAGTSADLAFAHLKAVWELVSDRSDQAIFAVPGTFSGEQLGLIAGMAAEAGIPLKGMVDSALAAVVTQPLSGPVLHLDIQLHRVVLSNFDIGPSVARDASFVIVEFGLKQMRDAWINVVADVFVRTTRFDPMHTAETEQKLYNSIGDWLISLGGRDNAQFEMKSGGKTHQVMVHVDQLVACNADIFPQLVQHLRARIQDDGATVMLSHRLKGFPGLHDTLSMIPGCDVVELDADAVTTGVIDNISALTSADGSLGFVTSLSRGMSRGAGVSADTELPRPTHVLYRSQAYRINEKPFLLGAEIPGDAHGVNLTGALAGVSRKHCSIVHRDGAVIVEDYSTYGTFINEERVDGSAILAIGDTLRVGSPGVSLELIQMQD